MLRKYYLAYGSNLNLEQMKKRCPSFKVIDTINLKGYRLVYKGLEDNYAYLTIEKCEKSYVPLALFSISLFDTIALDNYEGYPFSYSKKYFTVDVEGKEKDAFLYVMNNDNDYHIPSDEYIEICKKYDCYAIIELKKTLTQDSVKKVLDIIKLENRLIFRFNFLNIISCRFSSAADKY